MTKPLKQAIKIILNTIPTPKKVLEIGSRAAKNQRKLSNLRPYLPNSEYIGVDMQAGPGVDLVANAEKLPFKDGEFDLVLCLETFEHSNNPHIIANEMQRVVSDKGIVIASSQQNFPIHMHPSDYFRYTPFGLRALFPKMKQNLAFSISPPFQGEVKLNPQTVIFVGSEKKFKYLWGDLKRNLIAKKSLISVHKPYRHRLQDMIKYFARGIEEIWYRLEIEFF